MREDLGVTAAASAPAGRPRDPRRDSAILRATLDLVAERGFELSIEDVAERAGVAKTTIYRRYSSKDELVIAALETAIVRQPLPDTGSVRGDLVEFVRWRAANPDVISALSLFARLIGDLWRNPRLLALFTERLVVPGKAPVQAIIRRGIERGELRNDIDADIILYQVVGGLAYRMLMGGDPAFIEGEVEAHLDAAFQGVGQHGGGRK